MIFLQDKVTEQMSVISDNLSVDIVVKGHFRKLLERIVERTRIFISIVYLEG